MPAEDGADRLEADEGGGVAVEEADPIEGLIDHAERSDDDGGGGVMEEMLENGFDVETGMRRVRVVADGLIEAGRYEGMIPPAARGLARVEVEGDPNLGHLLVRPDTF